LVFLTKKKKNQPLVVESDRSPTPTTVALLFIMMVILVWRILYLY